MRRISFGEESYGAGSRYEQATRYYLEFLVDECAEQARDSCPDLPPIVDLLISLTGFSPRITVLAYKILQPRRLAVIPSDHAAGSINIIDQQVRADGRLDPADFSQRPCDPTDPLSIYRFVNDELDVLERRGGSRARAYIDITGGRKVMSATAALAAWQLDLGLCYIDGLYDEELKQAIPGSDRLLLLDNPTSIFGEQEMRAAHQSFDGGAFEAAWSRFDELARRLAQPGQARLMAALSVMYRAWCDLDLDALPDAVAEVRRTLRPVQRGLLSTTVGALYAQLAYLDNMTERDPASLLLSFTVLDDHYRQVGRHDFAALMSYRTIELCLEGHLASRFPGFSTERPDYTLLADDKTALTEDYRKVVDAVNGWTTRRTLPSKVGVFAAGALLHVLDDPLLPLAGMKDVDALRTLDELVKARNRSVLAHGTESVSMRVSELLSEQAVALLRAYWQLHHPDEDLEARRTELRFVRSVGAI